MRRLLIVALAACGGPPAPTPVAPPAPPPPTAPPAPTSDYPAARVDAVVDRLHGVDVRDPYRWLEDASQPDVQAWMKAQDGYARARLARLPGRAAIAARLHELLYTDSVGAPVHRGGRLFYLRKLHDHEKQILYWRKDGAAQDTVLLDPGAWSSDGSSGLGAWTASWDGRYVAYQVHEHNSDEAVVHVVEVATGKPLADALPGASYTAPSWSADGRGFYYTYTPPASATLAEADRRTRSEVRYHRLGADPAQDAVVHEPTGQRSWFLSVQASRDGHWLLLQIRRGSSGPITWLFKDARRPAQAWTPLFEGSDATVIDWRDRFYVLTNDGAPRYRVLAVDPARPARAAWREIVPEQDVVISEIDVAGGRLILTTMRTAVSELEVRELDGKLVRKVALPGPGTVVSVSGRGDDDAAYFRYGSYSEVGAVYETSLRSGAVRVWGRSTLPFDGAALVTEQVRFRSRDGTEIPMFLIHRKGVTPTGENPTLLTGYGGFRISNTPWFSATFAVVLEHGGVVAVPNLRGGGELGEAWHEAGTLAHKQNVFDDFLGAARYLIDQRWTRPGKLAISGGSNGGLLVGAATVQAPELFAAVVCLVPLLDMVRYHKFGLGAAWMTEYGSADDPAQFPALHAYSPYHHVRAGTRYPALLMMSSDHDDRVDPMHARKMTAALQAATTGGPVWLRIEQNAGHGGADVVAQQIEERADLLAFVFDRLGVGAR
jgi:prolyl oligopeptidase